MKTEKEIKSMISAIKREQKKETEETLPGLRGGRAMAIWALEWVLKEWEN